MENYGFEGSSGGSTANDDDGIEKIKSKISFAVGDDEYDEDKKESVKVERNEMQGDQLKRRLQARRKSAIAPHIRVGEILEADYDAHPVFSEMVEIFKDHHGEVVWKETARWVKFEENVEEGGNRWSKPHVGTLSLHSLFELRSLIMHGTVHLDMEAKTLEEICDQLLEDLVGEQHIPHTQKEQVKRVLLRRHEHQYEKHNSMSREGSSDNLGQFLRKFSETEMGLHQKKSSGALVLGAAAMMGGSVFSREMSSGNLHFAKKIPKGAETANILVGCVDFLEKPMAAFIRLSESHLLGDLTEVNIPTRFLFVLLGPPDEKYREIGRCLATVLADEIFREVAYIATDRGELLAGLDGFLDEVTVLPPGEWDPSIRIEPPSLQKVQRQFAKKSVQSEPIEVVDEEKEEQKSREETGLTRSGRIFGGLINDVKRKYPVYLSDFKDAISPKCVASVIFLYFGVLAPTVTFGGLLGDATHNSMAAMESLLAGLICGVLFGLFSGQPLNILAASGNVLVFEGIVYELSQSYGWYYLSFRLWIGIWMGVILTIGVAADASYLVSFITRFTEENFATLIASIFIVKALEKLINIDSEYAREPSDCYCQPRNETEAEILAAQGWNFTKSIIPNKGSIYSYSKYHQENITSLQLFNADNDNDASNCSASFLVDGQVVNFFGHESEGCSEYVANVFFFSCILFAGTFLLSKILKNFKTTSFFPAVVRSYISDFAVIIAIICMTVFDICVGIQTPKLSVPSSFQPTDAENRGWLIPPFGTEKVQNPWWTIFPAILLALLGSILVFMDQQITCVIVNRKENKLKKGGGYHLDLLMVAICIVICSFLGFPWFVSTTVLSINHVKSLAKESETAAPGEKPEFFGIREQRVTNILIFILVGVSVFLAPILKFIPMPILYGVFLYMGVCALDGLQMFERVLLFFMPKKYQPDVPYLRKVPLTRVHLFTFIQIACFGCLYLIKSFKETSILFPIMLVVMVGVRKLLDFVFTKEELKILDDILPAFRRQEKIEKEEEQRKGNTPTMEHKYKGLKYSESALHIEMATGNVIRIPKEKIRAEDINITKEMNNSSIWKNLEHQNSESDLYNHTFATQRKRQMSVVTEEADDPKENGINPVKFIV